jgi:hypothetical protein
MLHISEDSVIEFDSREVIAKLWRGDKQIVLSPISTAVSSMERRSGSILLLVLLGICDTRI